jgi:MFS family permease
MRKASLGTIVLTVFLDLLGFGLVVPYLPGVARELGASDLTAALLGASYSLMQLLFVPFWGHLSDRYGRRTILVFSISASALGMIALGSATSLWMLFAARMWSGAATANIAVAQAYIADVTTPRDRSRGMALIGAGIGVGFILGPGFGGLLYAHSHVARPGAVPAFAAAALSFVNLLLAIFYLPESLPPVSRGKVVRSASPFDRERFRKALVLPGVAIALAVNFVVGFSFSGLEQTFRLFTEDEFAMSAQSTGYVLATSGVVMVLVQGLLVRRLSGRVPERALVRIGLVIQVVGFVLVAASPGLSSRAVTVLFAAMGVIAFGSALTNPSLSALVSRCTDPQSQGMVLGCLQSAGALARVCGPAIGGLLYQSVSHRAPYLGAALGMGVAALVSLRLRLARSPTPRRADQEGS